MTHTRRTVCLLLLTVFLTGCVCGVNLSVWQTPRNRTAVLGEQVNITCHFALSTSEEGGQWKIKWKKNDNTECLNKMSTLDFNSSTVNKVNLSHTLTLHSVSVRDSGVYYCSVWKETPQLRSGSDQTGTELIVVNTTNNHSIATTEKSLEVNKSDSSSIIPTSTTSTPTVIWMALLASALIIVCITSILCCIYRGCCMRPKRKKESQSAQTNEDAGVVYAAVKLHKPHEKKNTPEASEAPDAGCAANTEVLYSDIRIKS